ncbi:MAG: hypothetical protein HQ494_07875 [Rhodospirillales bacterium]|nr:hypothetical protein [Rhodospirillales bacterium]
MTNRSFRNFLFSGLAVLALGGCQSVPGNETEVINQSLSRTAEDSEANRNYKAAAQNYRSLLERQPDDRTAQLGLARNLRYSGNAKSAVQILIEAGAEKSGDVGLLLELAKAKIALAKADEAIAHVTAAVKAGAKDWDVYVTMGIGYDLLQSYDEAWTAYQTAINLSPGNGAVLNNMAFSAALNGKLDLAIKILEDASLPVRRNPQIRQNLAFFYGIRGDMDKAGKLAERDLDKEAVRNNLAVFSRFRKSARPADTPTTK